MREQYDVVVIGSGFGGAITGARLSQAGRSVAILEKGRRWDRREFPRSVGQVRQGIWREGESHGFIDYKVFNRIDVIQGVGVGGGSLHYFNVNLRAPEEILARPEWPAHINRSLLEPYYELAYDMLDSRPLVPPRGYDLPARTTAFMEAAQKAGRTPELVPIAVHTGELRPNRHSGIMQDPCDYSGDCLIGCRTHSKNTLDLNYIPMSERKSGLEVFPLHAVSRIEPISGSGSGSGGGYKVHFNRGNPDDPAQSEPGFVIGRKVIVSAGTLGTTELLLRCRDLHKTLPNLSPMLGRRFSGNGDMLFSGTLETSRIVDPGNGPSITAGAVFSKPGSKHRIYIEDLGFPNPFMWLLEGTFPSVSRTWGLGKAAASYLGAALGLRKRHHSRIAFEGDQLFAGTRTQHFLPYLGMGTDAGDGVMKLDEDGRIDVDWDPRGSMEMFREMDEALHSLSAAAGGKHLESFLWEWPFRRLLTAHPLGGCVMSNGGADKGVVNDRGEVFGYEGLYVADGSIIPSALSTNPSMTISALAERVAYWIANGKELSGGATAPANS